MALQFANNVSSTLAAGITNVATSLTVFAGDGAKFPTPGNSFYCTLFQVTGGVESNWEVVLCTARAGDVLTITRAQDGTTGKAFNTGDPIQMRFTAAIANSFMQGANNLSEVVTPATARTNLGLGTAATTAASAYATSTQGTKADNAMPLAGGTFTGNVIWSGVGIILQGDFSNATNASRTIFQTSTAGGNSSMSVMPNGAGTSAGFNFFGLSTPATTPIFAISMTSGVSATLNSYHTAGSTTYPMTFQIDTVEYFRLNVAGRLLIGTTSDDGVNGLQVNVATSHLNKDVVKIKNLGFNGEYDNGNSGSAITITWSNGQNQKVTLNAATPAITIGAPPAVGHYQLRLIQDGTGSRAPTWAGISASRWLGSAAAPPVNLVASSETVVNFFFDGANIVQSLSKVGA